MNEAVSFGGESALEIEMQTAVLASKWEKEAVSRGAGDSPKPRRPLGNFAHIK